MNKQRKVVITTTYNEMGIIIDTKAEEVAQPNLQLATETISRQAAIDTIEDFPHGDVWNVESMEEMVDRIEQLPSAQPEIIRCRECKFASGDSRICMQFGHSPIGELDFCAWAERITDE